MQIQPPTLVQTSALAGLSTQVDGPGKSIQAAQGEALSTRGEADAPKVADDGGVSGVVSLSGGTQPAWAANAIAPVYAEIWKDGVKLAEVDIHGQVISSSGLVMPATAGGSGPLVAAQRAAQVAQRMGGEIRTAGQLLDAQTLLMRAKLANAYAV